MLFSATDSNSIKSGNYTYEHHYAVGEYIGYAYCNQMYTKVLFRCMHSPTNETLATNHADGLYTQHITSSYVHQISIYCDEITHGW